MCFTSRTDGQSDFWLSTFEPYSPLMSDCSSLLLKTFAYISTTKLISQDTATLVHLVSVSVLMLAAFSSVGSSNYSCECKSCGYTAFGKSPNTLSNRKVKETEHKKEKKKSSTQKRQNRKKNYLNVQQTLHDILLKSSTF